MKQVKYIILFTIISFVYLSENIFAYPVYLLPPDDVTAAKVIEIIPECNGVSAGDTINMTAKTQPEGIKVVWQIPEYHLTYSVKSTSDITAEFHAGKYRSTAKVVPVKACPSGSNSDACCTTIGIKIYDCKECSGGNVVNKEDGTLTTYENMCCVEGEKVQKNPIPHDKKLEDCPNREDNPNKGKDCNGCSVPEEYQYMKNPDDPMGDGKASFRPACCKHDECYGTCSKDNDNKKICDKDFKDNMYKICKSAYKGYLPTDPDKQSVNKEQDCCGHALVYWLGVWIGGDKPYERRQKKGCNCCGDNEI